MADILAILIESSLFQTLTREDRIYGCIQLFFYIGGTTVAVLQEVRSQREREIKLNNERINEPE